jgi:hypothetical protein
VSDSGLEAGPEAAGAGGEDVGGESVILYACSPLVCGNPAILTCISPRVMQHPERVTTPFKASDLDVDSGRVEPGPSSGLRSVIHSCSPDRSRRIVSSNEHKSHSNSRD